VEEPVEQPWSGVLQWTYTSDGANLIVLASDGSLYLVDADTLSAVGTPGAPLAGFGVVFPTSFQLSTSGDWLAIGYGDGTVRVSAVTPQGLLELFRTAPVPGGSARVHWLEGERFLNITPSSAAVFDMQNPTPLAQKLGGDRAESDVQAVVGSPDGQGAWYIAGGHFRRISASGDDGSLDVVLPIDPVGLTGLAVSPDGSWAAVLGAAPEQEQDDPTTEVVLNLSTVSLPSGEQRVVRQFPASTESMSLAIAPDNETLAFVSGAGEVSQIDASSDQPRGEPLQVTDVTALQYSPDGQVLFVADFSGAVSSFDVDTGEVDTVLDLGPSGGYVTRLALTPRQDRLVAATGDGFIYIADPRSARPIGSAIQAGSTQLAGVAVSRDGSRLAAVDIDGSMYLWNLATRRALGPPLRTDSSAVADPVFLGNGRQIVTASFDALLSWDLDPDTWVATACALVGRDLSEEEWTTFLPDEPHTATCPNG
jgi:WD40 repeat protein